MPVVINEIMIDPNAVSDPNGEWFELHNTDAVAVDLNGWAISDGINFETISGSLIIPAGGYLVFGPNGNPGTNGGVTVDYVYSTLTLANSSGEVRVYDGVGGSPGNEVDRVFYESSDPYGSGVSMELNDPGADNLFGGSGWSSAISS